MITKSTMTTISFDEMLKPNRLALQLLGLWPARVNVKEKCSSVLSTFDCLRLGFAIVSLTSLIGPQLYSLIYYWGDVSYLAENGSLALVFTLLYFKHLYMLARRHKFVMIYHYVERFWRITDKSNERMTYEVPARIGRVVTLVAIAACVANYILTVGLAIFIELRNYHHGNESLQRRRLLPVDLAYGFNYQATPIYLSLFIIQMINLVHVICVADGCDATVISAVLHLIGQFRLINYRLRTIGEKLQTGSYNQQAESFKKDIGQCIEHHRIVVDITDTFSRLISPMVFGQLLCSGLQICISCYDIIEGSAPLAVMIKCGVILTALLVQLVMWYVPGDFLDEESGAVVTSICHELPWFELSNSQQRDLAFVMMRAQKTCKIIALYQVTSVSQLTQVFKAACSYMAMLRSFKH